MLSPAGVWASPTALTEYRIFEAPHGSDSIMLSYRLIALVLLDILRAMFQTVELLEVGKFQGAHWQHAP